MFQSFSKSKNINRYLGFTIKCPRKAERLFTTIKKPVFEKGNADWISELPSVI